MRLPSEFTALFLGIFKVEGAILMSQYMLPLIWQQIIIGQVFADSVTL